jgi:hypothetical protein
MRFHFALGPVNYVATMLWFHVQLREWGRTEVDLEVVRCYFRKGGADHDFVKECTSENKYEDERAETWAFIILSLSWNSPT